MRNSALSICFIVGYPTVLVVVLDNTSLDYISVEKNKRVWI